MTTEVSNGAEPGQGKLAPETRKDADERKRAAVERQNVSTFGALQNVEINVALWALKF